MQPAVRQSIPALLLQLPTPKTLPEKKGKKRTQAISQMLQTIQFLSAVTSIKSFINQHFVKRCCYFNKKYQSQ